MLYGQGAGAMPTGSAVVSDIIDLTRNILAGQPRARPAAARRSPLVELRPHDEVRCAYYLRFSVKDEPGVLARTASTLAERRISIAAVQQREQNDQGKPRAARHRHAPARARRTCAPPSARSTASPTTLAPTRLIRIETSV